MDNGVEKVVPELQNDHQNYVLYKGGCCCAVGSRKTVNYVVLGQTGSGKTTLVDSFLNHLMGVDFYDKFRYKLVDESKIIAQKVELVEGESEQERAKKA